jgi:hypothetical protein
MRRLAFVVAPAACVALMLGACSGSSSNEQRDAVNQAQSTVVATVHYGASGFDVGSLSLKHGQSIVLANSDTVDHRFRATPGTLDSGAQRPGDQVTWNFTGVGTFQVGVDGNTDRHLAVTVSN